MKNIKTGLAIVLLVSVYFFSCNKENTEKKDEWIEIDSIVPAVEISQLLNSIISKQNMCLMGLGNNRYDSVFQAVFNPQDLEETDTCNVIPDIDFDKFTLTYGKVYVPYFAYKISDINLFLNDVEELYSYEISMDTCENCYTMGDVKYFWKVYPTLNPEYKFKVLFKNVNRI